MLEKLKAMIRRGFTDDTLRRDLMFDLLNIVLGLVALVMTVVNIVTREWTLMGATLIFSVLCAANVGLVKLRLIKNAIHALFLLEALVLLGFFIVTGIPEGFSVLWILVVPSFTLAIFRTKVGGLVSGIAFVMIIFFFWFPVGRGLLQYAYNETFMLRFPFVYVCLFLIALYIEQIRLGTWERLRDSEKQYRYLSRHDALTGIYSRHAFYQELDCIFERPAVGRSAMVLLDVDDFKTVNDRYGHNGGDEVLRRVAQIILGCICENCVACRWGGEEFLVLMRCEHDPRELAEAIRRKVEAADICYGAVTIRCTVSAGVAITDDLTAERLGEFINRADRAMYISKSNGKNQTTVLPM